MFLYSYTFLTTEEDIYTVEILLNIGKSRFSQNVPKYWKSYVNCFVNCINNY